MVWYRTRMVRVQGHWTPTQWVFSPGSVVHGEGDEYGGVGAGVGRALPRASMCGKATKPASLPPVSVIAIGLGCHAYTAPKPVCTLPVSDTGIPSWP